MAKPLKIEKMVLHPEGYFHFPNQIQSCKLIGWKESRAVGDRGGLKLDGQVPARIRDLIAITINKESKELIINH